MTKKEIIPEPMPPTPAEDPSDAPAEDGPSVAGREVALFVCVVCGKEKRSQKHYNFVCTDCTKLHL